MIFTHFYKSDNHVTNLIWSQFSLKTETHCVTKLALHHSAIYIETRKQCGPFAALPSTNIHHTFRAQRCPKNNNHNRNIFLADEREFIPGVFAMSSSLPPPFGSDLAKSILLGTKLPGKIKTTGAPATTELMIAISIKLPRQENIYRSLAPFLFIFLSCPPPRVSYSHMILVSISGVPSSDRWFMIFGTFPERADGACWGRRETVHPKSERTQKNALGNSSELCRTLLLL